ncbi:MAG: TadE/TadG family type IV pilus assembly protein [Vulcanimicrobiaceae bacterium]
MVESVIVLAATLAILFGIIDFGRALYTYNLVANAAREGARYAIVRGTDAPPCPATNDCPIDKAGVKKYVLTRMQQLIDQSQVTVDANWSASGACNTAPFKAHGCLVAVNVVYPFAFILPYLPTFTMNMSSTSTMVISQ